MFDELSITITPNPRAHWCTARVVSHASPPRSSSVVPQQQPSSRLVLQFGKNVVPDNYGSIVAAPFVKLFASTDRGIRIAFLNNLSDFVFFPPTHKGLPMRPHGPPNPPNCSCPKLLSLARAVHQAHQTRLSSYRIQDVCDGVTMLRDPLYDLRT
ncbi:hypothetical protein BDR05DRAFT_624887 [Suillus weaverae]|nr:hypothetical protein BDR05DRAFT_624887 [Suillus weaverae]